MTRRDDWEIGCRTRRRVAREAPPRARGGTAAQRMSVARGIAAWVSFAAAATWTAPVARAQRADESLRVTHDVETREITLMIGPLELSVDSGHGSSHDSARRLPLQFATIPVDAYLNRFDVQMVDRDGSPITNRLLHHVNLLDASRRELFSPIARRFFAAGQETEPGRLPAFLGVRVRRGDRLVVSSMFHNPTDTAYADVYLRIRLHYRRRGLLLPLAVHPFYVDVMPPVGPKEFDLPPGRHTRSWEGRPAIAGRLLGVGGHVHRYAETIRFEDTTAGTVIWEAAPVVDSTGAVLSVPVAELWRRGGVPITPDHTYRLTVVYDNPTGDSIPDGGMGAFGGVFLPAWGEEWPEVDRSDPAYVADMAEARAVALRKGLADWAASLGR